MRDYEMFGNAGNRACQAMVDSITKKINSEKKITPTILTELVNDGIRRIEIRFSEVNDTEPIYHISRELNKALESNGYSFRLNSHLHITH